MTIRKAERPPIEVLRERYPLRVVYPFVGPHVFMFDRTHDRQHHVMVARDEESLVRAWRSALTKQPDREPKEFWRGTIVSCPPEVVDTSAAGRYESEVDSWWSMLVWNVEEYHQRYGALPPGVARCRDFAYKYAGLPGYDDLSEEELRSFKADPRHYSCANCIQRFVFDHDFYGFYEKHKDAFAELDKERWTPPRHRPPPKPHPLPNMSLPHDPAQPLYVVDCHGGHHQPGAGMGLVKEGASYTTPLFFFQGEKASKPAEILRAFVSGKTLWEQRQKQEKLDRERHHRQEKVRRHAVVETIFGVEPRRTTP